jgi:L-ascorbate metabolism protein UlaG (beta-lactamase superfamily)
VTLAITRVVNASVLIEIGDHVVLTDPYFERRWFLRMREPIGLSVAELPRLAAILGGHGVLDHWQPGSLAAYPFKDATPVYVATRSMEAKAREAGFSRVEVLSWGDERRLASGLELEVAPAQRVVGSMVNSYVLSAGATRVFFGGEARDIEPLRRYREGRPPVDVALLPIDGSRLFRHRLVMDGRDAISAARVLGARVLVPIHYAMKALPPLLRTPFSEVDMADAARGAPDLDVVRLDTGRRWTWGAAAPG